MFGERKDIWGPWFEREVPWEKGWGFEGSDGFKTGGNGGCLNVRGRWRLLKGKGKEKGAKMQVATVKEESCT